MKVNWQGHFYSLIGSLLAVIFMSIVLHFTTTFVNWFVSVVILQLLLFLGEFIYGKIRPSR